MRERHVAHIDTLSEDDPSGVYLGDMLQNFDQMRKERDEARRSGLTLTAEERAALEWARRLVDDEIIAGEPNARPARIAHATLDRLLAGARTVTEPTAEEVQAVADYLCATSDDGFSWKHVAWAAIAAGLDPRRLKEGT